MSSSHTWLAESMSSSSCLVTLLTGTSSVFWTDHVLLRPGSDWLLQAGWNTALGWGLLNQFSLFCYFPCFSAIFPVFWAAETPDKYEHDLKYLTYALTKQKFTLMVKLINRAGNPYCWMGDSDEDVYRKSSECITWQIIPMMSWLLTHWCQDKIAPILQMTFSNAFSIILIQISLTFVPNGSIKNKPALVQVMAWHQTGNKPLSEPWCLLTHTWLTHPQWVGVSQIPSNIIVCSKACSNQQQRNHKK